jgi:catechol 2,3-dioxygenase-like lactoylglutathione lyase family enzyme
VITQPINGAPATAANGGTIGFLCKTPEEVEAWHAAGVVNGGTTCENPPGIREGALGKLYLAYLRDPDGHKLCGLHRMG